MVMDISDWRKKIDEIDQKLVELLNQRAHAAREIGRLKRNTQMPIYEPQREKEILQNIAKGNHGPLSDRDLKRVYERLIDVMRELQKEEIMPAQRTTTASDSGDTEIEADVND